MPIKSLIRTIPHYPKQGIMFRDITTLLKDPGHARLAGAGNDIEIPFARARFEIERHHAPANAPIAARQTNQHQPPPDQRNRRDEFGLAGIADGADPALFPRLRVIGDKVSIGRAAHHQTLGNGCTTISGQILVAGWRVDRLPLDIAIRRVHRDGAVERGEI